MSNETSFLVSNVMTKKVISVHPDTPLIEAASLISKNGFSGVPVVDRENTLQGILTEYDLISKDSLIHLPTFQKILQDLPVFRKDRSEFQEDIQKVSELKVRDVMNSDPLMLDEDAPFEEAVHAFSEHHKVNPIPIVDKGKKVVGIISRFDLIKPLHELTKS